MANTFKNAGVAIGTSATTIYTTNTQGVITDCCGNRPGKKYQYPSQYICHITTLACALEIKIIHGFLYNII